MSSSFSTINTQDLRDARYDKSEVSPREVIKVAPQVKKIQKNFQELGSTNIHPERFFVMFSDLNPVSMLQLSVYEQSAYNENICSVKCLGKSVAKIIQNIVEWFIFHKSARYDLQLRIVLNLYLFILLMRTESCQINMWSNSLKIMELSFKFLLNCKVSMTLNSSILTLEIAHIKKSFQPIKSIV